MWSKHVVFFSPPPPNFIFKDRALRKAQVLNLIQSMEDKTRDGGEHTSEYKPRKYKVSFCLTLRAQMDTGYWQRCLSSQILMGLCNQLMRPQGVLKRFSWRSHEQKPLGDGNAVLKIITTPGCRADERILSGEHFWGAYLLWSLLASGWMLAVLGLPSLWGEGDTDEPKGSLLNTSPYASWPKGPCNQRNHCGFACGAFMSFNQGLSAI